VPDFVTRASWRPLTVHLRTPHRALRQDPHARGWLAPLVLTLLCGGFFFYGLAPAELYRTESLRAIIAAEFLRTGDWVVPRLYGEPLFTKPPGMYAAIALASWPVGRVTEWTARLPSALAATALVLLFYRLFRRHLGRTAGLIAAAVVPMSLMVLDKATAAEIDMLQVAWVTAALMAFLRALEAEEQAAAVASLVGAGVLPSRAPLFGLWWLAALLCVAGGVLTKWTAPAFFYLTVVPLLWRRRQLRLLAGRRHLLAAGVAAGLCLAWVGAAVAREGWDTFFHTVKRQAFMHLLPTHHHRPYPWLESLTHPLRVGVAALPVSAFALLAVRPGFGRLWDDRGRRLLQFLHCWTWPNLLFWSLVPAHNTRHSFPLYPGLAGLAALVWLAWATGRLAWPWERFPPPKALLATVFFWVGVKLIFVHWVTPERNHTRAPAAKGRQLAAHVPCGQTLYLFHLKDEGIMFYYGRPVRRLASVDNLPCTTEPLYCILEAGEWPQVESTADLLLRLHDEQGAPILLARVWRQPSDGLPPG
jgi:4-amino-4-deoxy-L-arabinose transferase-like glycosyltransferase